MEVAGDDGAVEGYEWRLFEVVADKQKCFQKQYFSKKFQI